MKIPLLPCCYRDIKARRYFSFMVSISKRAGKPPGRRVYRRRGILLCDVVSLSVYLNLYEAGRVVAPIGCPDGCNGGWRRHSEFKRQWVDYDCVVFTLMIVRV